MNNEKRDVVLVGVGLGVLAVAFLLALYFDDSEQIENLELEPTENELLYAQLNRYPEWSFINDTSVKDLLTICEEHVISPTGIFCKNEEMRILDSSFISKSEGGIDEYADFYLLDDKSIQLKIDFNKYVLESEEYLSFDTFFGICGQLGSPSETPTKTITPIVGVWTSTMTVNVECNIDTKLELSYVPEDFVSADEAILDKLDQIISLLEKDSTEQQQVTETRGSDNCYYNLFSYELVYCENENPQPNWVYCQDQWFDMNAYNGNPIACFFGKWIHVG